eukprot:3933043-Rhodomonas_salina.2
MYGMLTGDSNSVQADPRSSHATHAAVARPPRTTGSSPARVSTGRSSTPACAAAPLGQKERAAQTSAPRARGPPSCTSAAAGSTAASTRTRTTAAWVGRSAAAGA